MSRFSHLLLSAIAVTPFVHSLAVPKDLHSVSNQILDARAPIAFQAGDLISFENGKLFRRANESAPFQVFEAGSGSKPVKRTAVVKRNEDEDKKKRLEPKWEPPLDKVKEKVGPKPDTEELEEYQIMDCNDLGWVKLAEDSFAAGASGVLTKGITEKKKIVATKGMNDRRVRDSEWKLIEKIGKHDNLVEGLAKCKAYGVRHHYVMELVDGKPLTTRIDSKQYTKPASEKALKALMKGIFSAIEKMHDKGVAHCDIKGDNILVTGADKPIVIDLGEATTETKVDKIEVAGGIRAPEAETKSTMEIDPKSNDVWELGDLLVSLLLGKRPWTSATDKKAEAIWKREAYKQRVEACQKEWKDFSQDFCDLLADIFAPQLSRAPLSTFAKKVVNPNLKFRDDCDKDKKTKRDIERGEMVVTDVADEGDELVVRALMY